MGIMKRLLCYPEFNLSAKADMKISDHKLKHIEFCLLINAHVDDSHPIYLH